jgi:hypothetical protein
VRSAPLSWWRDPATIPPRQSLYDGHYIRRAIGATIGGGGRAKTTRGVYEGICMSVGFDIATKDPLPEGKLRVWICNGEEDQDELDRRVSATCQHYGITQDDLGGRLFVQSVRDNPLRIATLVNNRPVIDQTVLKYMTDFIKDNGIDVFMLDPLVSFHGVMENDNGHMDLVIKEGFGAIANTTNSAGEMFHHPGKAKPGQADTSVEDGRGASAILWAVRSARVFNFMTPEEAAKLGMAEDDRKLHIRNRQREGQHEPARQGQMDEAGGRRFGQRRPCCCRQSVEPAGPLQRCHHSGHGTGENTGGDWRIPRRHEVAEMDRICPRQSLRPEPIAQGTQGPEGLGTHQGNP